MNGNTQVISDKGELLAAAGCFGLLGIVTYITYEVKKTRYAVMRPRKIPTMLAIPPPDRTKVPEALQIDVTDAQLESAMRLFEEQAGGAEFAEWTWYPYQSDVFVNIWNTTPDKEGSIEYVNNAQVFLQWLSGWFGGILSAADFYADIPARWQTQLLATVAMAVLPPTTTDPLNMTIKTAVPNAQHFRRDYQYLRVRGMELEIPIPASAKDSTKPDWGVVRMIWWEMIHLVYASAASPLRLSVDMRIMADSDMILAPQRGNTHGTVVMEIGTVPDIVSDEDWAPFCQQVYDKLKVFAPDGRIRPHWGKEWCVF